MARSACGIGMRRFVLGYGSLLLGLSRFDGRFVMPDDAPGRRTDDRMMAGDVTYDGPNGGTFQAPLGATDARQQGNGRGE